VSGARRDGVLDQRFVRLSVRRMSTKTGTPPLSRALAVETKVKDGMMTSSPG